MTLSAPEYVEGLAFFTVTAGGSLATAIVLVRRRLDQLDVLARLIAGGVIATTALVAAHLIPGVLGVLGRESAALTALAFLGIALLVPVRAMAVEEARETPPDPRLSKAMALAGCSLLGVYLVALLLSLGTEPPTSVDTLTFHLPGVARWIETGTIWQIDQFIPDQAHGYYPNTGNVVELAAVLPWRSDFAVRLLAVPFLVLTALATYGCGRELGAPRSSAALLAAVALSVPAVTLYAIERPTPDAVALAGFSAGAFFLLRHDRIGTRADLVLAGLGLGIAFGTKWYGVSAVIALLAVWATARALRGLGVRRVAGETALVAGLVVATGGIWLLRNWAEAGNPLFPVEVSVLGITIFDAPFDPVREQFGFSISHYLLDGGAWRQFILPAYRDFLALPGAVLVAGLVGSSLALALARRASSGRALAFAAAAVAVGAAYLITPGGALGPDGVPGGAGVNSRYLVPALLLAAPVCALAIGGAGRWRPALELIALAAIADGVYQSTPTGIASLGVATALVGAGCLLLAKREAILTRVGALAAPVAVGAVVAAAMLISAGLGFALQRSFNDGRYADDPALGGFVDRYADGQRVGLAGLWRQDRVSPVLPAFGPRLGNEVAYVGEFEHGILRPETTRDGFLAALGRGGYDLLVVGEEQLPTHPSYPVKEWAREAGYREVAAEGTLSVLGAPGVPEHP